MLDTVYRMLGNIMGCTYETPRAALIDVTGYGDSYMQYHDTGRRQFTLQMRARGDAARKAYNSLQAQMNPNRKTVYTVNRVGISAYTINSRFTHTHYLDVEWAVTVSLNTASLKYFTAGGIAHFIDPSIPWAERRLTYKRARGWKFPHRPYWIVAKERRDELARLAIREEGVYNDEWYDRGDADYGYDEE